MAPMIPEFRGGRRPDDHEIPALYAPSPHFRERKDGPAWGMLIVVVLTVLVLWRMW